MKIKLLPMLVCARLLAPMQEILCRLNMCFNYINNDCALYGISCTNSKLNESFKSYVNKSIEQLPQELLEIQAKYFERFKEAMLVNFKETVLASFLETDPNCYEDPNWYVYQYLQLTRNSKIFPEIFQENCKKIQEYFSKIDSDYVYGFLAIQWFLTKTKQSPLCPDMTFPPLLLSLPDLRFWFRLFLFHEELEISHHEYRFVVQRLRFTQRNELNKVVQNSYCYRTRKSTRNFSVCQLRSHVLPYFGLICDPKNQSEIYGVMRFDKYKHEPVNILGPLFLQKPIKRDDSNNLIKLTVLNLIMTAPGFLEYSNTIKTIITDIGSFFGFCPASWDNMMLDFFNSIAFDSQNSSWNSDTKLFSDTPKASGPSVFGPVYTIDPETKQPEDLYSIKEGKLSESEYLSLVN